MTTLSPLQIIEMLDEIIRTLNENENEYYIAIDLAHQFRDELIEAFPDDYDEQ